MKRNHTLYGFNGFVPVIFGKKLGYVPLPDIDKQGWTTAHGKAADGTQVNSPRYANYGDSTIVQTDAGAMLSIPTAELDVLAQDFLKGKGYTVTPAPAKTA